MRAVVRRVVRRQVIVSMLFPRSAEEGEEGVDDFLVVCVGVYGSGGGYFCVYYFYHLSVFR